MAFIKLPPAETPREALERIAMETAALNTELDAYSNVLPDLLKLGSEASEYEATIERAKEETYTLLQELLRQRRQACADEYCMLLELECAEMAERQRKREAT